MNAIATIGHNSRAAEIAALTHALRVELETHELTPIWRARWEMLIDQTIPTPDKLIGIIMSFFQELRGKADPGVKMVEMLSGLADRRVRLGVKLQEDRGFLVKEKGGHRGQASVFSVQIPDKTLRELEGWRHEHAAIKGGIGGMNVPPLIEKGGIAGSSVPPMPPLPPLKGGTLMPPIPSYKDNNNKHQQQGARDEPLVHANGEAFEAPGFKLEYKLVELTGAMLGLSKDKSRLCGELIAWQWANEGFVPNAVAFQFQQAMATRKVFFASAENKLQLELEHEKERAASPPAARAGPLGQKHWRDQKREDSQDTSNVIKKLAQELRSQKQ